MQWLEYLENVRNYHLKIILYEYQTQGREDQGILRIRGEQVLAALELNFTDFNIES
jgi:hypothetical protein